MAVPKVAIIGRPNVGKSSLFNWLAGRRIAVVDEEAGVTRDRVTTLVHEGDRFFELVDTGGMGVEDVDELTEQIEEQIRIGIEEADLVLFVVDAQAGLVPLDREVAERLRRVEKAKLLVVNKCDSPKTDAEIHEFQRLVDAETPVIITSVKAKRHRDRLLAAIVEHLPPPGEEVSRRLEVSGTLESEEAVAEPEMKLAIVGRRNVGKSTFINALATPPSPPLAKGGKGGGGLAKAERVIVSEVPGTTRDSIDVRFEMDGKSFVAIDTPGVRRRKSIASDVEYYGLVRAQRSIRAADVVLMFFDAAKTISKVDKQLVSEIHEHYKPCVFVVNKWDLGQKEEMTSEAWGDYLLETFGTMRHVPVAFVTATRSRNVKPVINLAQNLFKQARLRVPTGPLNRIVQAAVKENPPPYRKNKRPKIFFATQVGVQPPTIVLKCSDPALFDETWKRYLLGVLREELPFDEVPIRLFFRAREPEEDRKLRIED